MGTYWHKQGWLAGDLDEVTGQPVPGAMPPGLYCKDEAAFRAVEKAAGVRRVEDGFTQRVGDNPTWRPLLTVGGTMVRVATPEEAEILRAIAPSATDPDKVERLVEARAREQEAEIETVTRKMGTMLVAAAWNDPAIYLRALGGDDILSSRPASTGATRIETSGTVSIQSTWRSKSWKGPQNLGSVTGPNRQARRAAAAHARRA